MSEEQIQGVDQKIAQLRAEHGELAVLRLKTGEVVACKTPRGPDYARYTDKISRDSEDKYLAGKELVYCCRVLPDSKGELDAIIDKLPGIVPPLANSLRKLAGGELEVEILGN